MKQKYNFTKEKLDDMYENQKLSMRQIAKIYNCSPGIVCYYIHKFNIKPRPGIGVANIPIKLEGELFEIVEGHLLGDGYLHKIYGVNCQFSLKSKYKNYAKMVAKTLKILEPSEVRKLKSVLKYKGEIRRYTNYVFETRYLISPEYRKRWYPDGIKTIPQDFRLTPLTAQLWYLDDGGFIGRGSMRLCTHSFTERNLEETVLPQLKQILDCKNNEIKIYKKKSHGYQPEIYIPRKYTKKFLEYIGKCPIKEYNYKWDIKPYKQKARKYL